MCIIVCKIILVLLCKFQNYDILVWLLPNSKIHNGELTLNFPFWPYFSYFLCKCEFKYLYKLFFQLYLCAEHYITILKFFKYFKYFENLLNLQETKFFPRQNLNLIICIIHFMSKVTVRWLVIFSNKWLLHFFYCLSCWYILSCPWWWST